ncbi:MAG: hypothetical protein RIB77_46230 [Sandaracinaceae bacterium]
MSARWVKCPRCDSEARGGFEWRGRPSTVCEDCRAKETPAPDPLAGEQRVRAVLTFDLELDGPGPYSEEDRHHALECLLAMGGLPTVTRFLRVQEPRPVSESGDFFEQPEHDGFAPVRRRR